MTSRREHTCNSAIEGGGVDPPPLPIQAARCAGRTVELLLRKQLHLRRSRVGSTASLPDGRRFTVFRESVRDGDLGAERVTLSVWFHLRGIPQGSRVRRTIFERVCLVNTLLFAGFDGYRVKLWMVNPVTADYAGLYAWRTAEEAENYARYIIGILSPVSVRGSVGYQVLPGRALEELVESRPRRYQEPGRTGRWVHRRSRLAEGRAGVVGNR